MSGLRRLFGQQDSAADWLFLVLALAFGVALLAAEIRAIRAALRLYAINSGRRPDLPGETRRELKALLIGLSLAVLAAWLASFATCA